MQSPWAEKPWTSSGWGRARGGIFIYVKGPTTTHYITWRLTKMNLTIRSLKSQMAHGDSFHNDRYSQPAGGLHPCNPPFNVSDLSGERLLGDRQ